MATGGIRFLGSAALWGTIVFILGTPSAVAQEELSGAEAALPAEGRQSPEIDSGFLIVNNRYVPSPYRIEHDGEHLRINGIAIGLPAPAVRFPGRGDFGGGPAYRDRRGFGRTAPGARTEAAARSALVQAERLFLQGSLVIKFTDGMVGVFPHGEAILHTLASDADRTDKLRSLTSNSRQSITLAQWSALVDAFEPGDALRQRLTVIDEARTVDHAPLSQPPQYALYVLTVVGMMLTVASFGIVLSHRPQHFCRWSDVNRIPRDVRLVIGCAVMVGVLCVFDLVCTLVAAHTMHFWEINPFGATLVAQPVALSVVKLLASLACVALLLSLRFYRGMQLASWWLCLGLTLLAARWVVFNSLLLA